MIAVPSVVRALTTNYSLIMDADRNPLWRLPPAQRFQTIAGFADDNQVLVPREAQADALADDRMIIHDQYLDAVLHIESDLL